MSSPGMASPDRDGARLDVVGLPVAVLDGGSGRVIVCPAGIQWIVQHLYGGQWRSRSFCRTKEALLRCCGRDPHPALAALPDRIIERTRAGAAYE
jgi:hypothetical protein